MSVASEVLAVGTVLYLPVLGYPQERQDVEFLSGFRLRSTNNVIDSDEYEVSWRVSPSESDAEINEESCFDITNRSNIRQGSRRVTRRSSQVRAPESGRILGLPAPSPRRAEHHLPGDEDSACMKAIEDIYRRVARVEKRLTETSGCTHDEIISEIVDTFRVTAKFDVLSQGTSPPSRPGRSMDTSFDSVLRPYVVSHIYKRDFHTFQRIARDVHDSFADSSDVLFFPSYAHILLPHAHVAGHIVFRTAVALFDWLGISDPSDVKLLAFDDRHRSTEPRVRILGSLHFNRMESTDPLTLFIGASSGLNKLHVYNDNVHEHDKERPTVQFDSAQWDEENGMLTSRPAFENVCVPPITELDVNKSCFALSWEAAVPCSQRRFSLHTQSFGDVQLGNIILRYPGIFIQGQPLCNAFGRMFRNGTISKFLS